jgi:hypothetical protein
MSTPKPFPVDPTQLDESEFATIGRAVVNLIARGHSVEFVPLSPKEGNLPSYSVSIPTIAFIGCVPLAELHELTCNGMEKAVFGD